MKREFKFNTCFLIFIINAVSVITNDYQLQCPEMCSCDSTRGRGSKSLKCGGSDHSGFLLQDLNLTSLEPYIVQLELSSNGITHLEIEFLKLHNLQKLDLSRNKIEKIDSKAFIGLWNLKKLDLSNNRITELQSEIFEPLQFLERLKLNNNLLVHIYEGGFDSLKSLKQLDITENPLMCDCDLMWLVEWSKNSSVKLSQPLKCESPPLLKGQQIKKLKLHCNDHSSIYTSENGLELKPMHDQIVFEGDSLCLRCRSLTAGALGGESRDVRVTWTWKNKDPASYFDKIKIENRLFADHGFVESQLRIDEIQRGHSGDWYCHLLSEQGNHSTAITVIVLSDDSKYCSESITKNNKGVYFWPKTVVGFTVDLPCEGEQSTTILNAVEPRASYSCNESGFWENLNTTQCPYISETTKILEQFSRLNLSIPKNSVLESAKKLKNFTVDGKVITDAMDVVFISKTIENYLPFVKGDKELGHVLIDIIASVMQAPKSLLTAAQKENLACSSIVKSVEKISRDTPTIQSHKSVLVVEEFGITGAFPGMRCTWFSNSRNDKNPGRSFHCSTSNKTVLGTNDKVIEASIQIPSSLFYQLEMQGKSVSSIRQLIVSMFENNNFFPDIKNGDEDVTSCVVGSNLMGVEVTNLTDPVYVMLRIPTISYAASPKPVWWDQSLDDGNGWWNQDGCQLAHFMQGLVVFHCDRLGYFGLLQDTRYIKDYSGRYIGAKSRLCHPAIYTGSFILIVCLIVSMVTYLISHSFIQMSRRAKHSVVNTWLSISLLCFMFSCGIYQTEDMKICQGVGLILHYLSLSTLLWMSVTANNMYKRLSKSDHLDNAPEDDLPPGVPIQKPILGLYLVGWGIGLIVCGISGAVNLREYAGQHFCFLGSGPALSAIFVPAGILLAVLILFYFLTLCAIRNNDMNGQLSEGTQGTENVDLELLEVPVPNGCVDRRSIQSMVTTDSDDVEDPEHSPIIQLKAHVIVLVLFCFLWITAALSVLDAFRDYFSYQEDIFSILYCLFAFCLGAFILYFYCVARSDVRSQWTVLRKVIQGNGFQCCRSRSVSDSHGNVQIPTTAVVVSNGTGTRHTVSALSSSSINSSNLTNKSNNHNSNRVKAVKKLNNCDAREDSVVIHSKTTNNVNLVAMHRQMYRSNNSMPTYHEISGPDCVEAFYNPRQSIVARKFFKKQRRNKRNDLGLRRRGDGGGTSDGEVSQARRTWRPSAESAVFLSSDMENTSDKIGPTFFGYGSKVNNTNIHVGQSSGKHKKSQSPKNPNILSDSDEESRSKLPIDRLVIGAEEEAGTSSSKNNDRNNYGCGLSRVDEMSVSEEVNSTAVNLSENSAKEVSQELLPKENDTDDDYSNDVCNDVTPTGPDYRTVELQCSLGENSCSDLNSEMNYCDSTNNDDCSSQTNCCNDSCPPDCCLKNKSTCDSFNEKIDNIRFKNESVEEKAEKSCVKKSTPQYVTVVDPQYGLVKVSVNEYKDFCSKSNYDDNDDEDDDETLVEHSPDSEKTKKETSV